LFELDERIISEKAVSRITHAAIKLMVHDTTNITVIAISSTTLMRCKDPASVAPCLL